MSAIRNLQSLLERGLTINDITADARFVIDNVDGKTLKLQGQELSDHLATLGLINNVFFDANTLLKADVDDTPSAMVVGEQTLVGRITGGSITALTSTQVRTLINVEDGSNAYVHPNHTGDVTSLADGATTITTNVVDNTKLAQVSTQTLKGRNTAGTGDVEDLTASQVRGITDTLSQAELQARAYGSTITSSVSPNAYTATLTPTLTSLTNGQLFVIEIHATNTGAVTLDIDGLGAKDLVKADLSAYLSGELTDGQFVPVVYDGTGDQFIVVGGGGTVEDEKQLEFSASLTVPKVLRFKAGQTLTSVNADLTNELSNISYSHRNTGTSAWTPVADFAALQTAVNSSGVDYYIELSPTFQPGWTQESQVIINYIK